MKIAMVVSVFPKLSETFIASKFLGLLALGQDVRVICSEFDRDALAYFPALAERGDLGRRVIVRRRAEPHWLAALAAPLALVSAFHADWRNCCQYLYRGCRRFGLDLLRQFYLDAELIECGADVVHFEFGSLASVRIEQVGWIGGRSVVSFRGHDLLFVGLDQKDYYRDVWEHADALHFLGNDLWSQARRRGCPPEKFRAIIPPAIDAEFFQSCVRKPDEMLGSRERPIRLVSAARLCWSKGFEYALQAVARLRAHGLNVEYRIVGGGSQADALYLARREMGLEDCIAFLGACPPSAVRDELRWADIFLHSAVAEGFSNVVLEAQAMELPVVTSDACGLPENVLDGVTGFVVARRDPAALAERIVELAGQPGMRREMGQAGRGRVLENFNFANQIDAFEELYGAVLASGLAPAAEASGAELSSTNSRAA